MGSVTRITEGRRQQRRNKVKPVQIVKPKVYTIALLHNVTQQYHQNEEFVEVCSTWEEAEDRITQYGPQLDHVNDGFEPPIGWLISERQVDQDARCQTHRLHAQARWYDITGARTRQPCHCSPDCQDECTMVQV